MAPNKRRKIVAFVNGYPLAGKDTFVEIAGTRLAQRGWGVSAMSTVDLVKDITRSLGIPDEPKTPEKRALWSELKASFERYDRFIGRHCMATANARFDLFKDSIFFLHVREPEAMDFMTALARPDEQIISIFVDRPDAVRVSSNESDRNVENYDYTVTIPNHGDLGAFAAAAISFAESLHSESTVTQ